jgi:DNA-binding PadR family transcriptional regulator
VPRLEALVRLTHSTALVLQALLAGREHGFDIMDATGLPSGTVYPILRRLDADGVVRSRWEKDGLARREQRPPRRCYELTSGGAVLARESVARARSVHRLRLSPRKAEA